MKIKNILILFSFIFGGVIVSLFVIWIQANVTASMKVYYKEFNKADLAGKIVYLSSSGGASFFKLDNKKEEYSVSTKTAKTKSHHLFHLTASCGDSLIKQPYSDTLLLIHDGQKYYYLFRRFE